MSQQQIIAVPGPPRFYRRFKSPSGSPNLAPQAASPIVTVSDFDFNFHHGSISSKRSKSVDASIARQQTQLRPPYPTSTGAFHTRNRTLPTASAANAICEPSQHRPQLSLTLPNNTCILPSTQSDSSSTPSISDSRGSSYGSSQTSHQKSTDSLARSPTPSAKPVQSTIPPSDSHRTARSRSRSRSRSSSFSQIPGYTTFVEVAPPLPTQASRASSVDLVRQRPDPLRSHPPLPLPSHEGRKSQRRSRMHKHTTIDDSLQQPRPPTRGGEIDPKRECLPGTASPRPSPKVSSQQPGESPQDQAQQRNRSRSLSHSLASEPTATAHRPSVYRNTASDPLPTRALTQDPVQVPSTSSSTHSSASFSDSQTKTQDTPAAVHQTPRVANKLTKRDRRKNSSHANASTAPASPPPTFDFMTGSMTNMVVGDDNSQSPSSTTTQLQDRHSLPTPPAQSSSTDPSSPRQSRFSIDGLCSLRRLSWSSKSNLQLQPQSQQPPPPLPMSQEEIQAQFSSYQASFTSVSGSATPTSSSTSISTSVPVAAPASAPASSSTPTLLQKKRPPTNQSQRNTPSPSQASLPPQRTKTKANNPSSPLLALTAHIETNLTLATHLFTAHAAQLSPTETHWIICTLSDTTRAIQSVKTLTESLRVEAETKNGRVGLGSRVKWKVRDSRRAKEMREELGLVHASLLTVLGRLCGMQGQQQAEAGPMPMGMEAEAEAGIGIGIGLAMGDESQLLPPPAPSRCPSVPVHRTPYSPRSLNLNETRSFPETAPINALPISPPSSVSENKPQTPPWDLAIEKQDAGMELVVDTPSDPVDTHSVGSSAVGFALCEPGPGFNFGSGSGIGSVGADCTNASELGSEIQSQSQSQSQTKAQNKLDEELLDMLAWRWKQGRVELS